MGLISFSLDAGSLIRAVTPLFQSIQPPSRLPQKRRGFSLFPSHAFIPRLPSKRIQILATSPTTHSPYPHPPTGSFGTYPSPIRTTMRAHQAAAESRPDHYIRYLYPAHLNDSRSALAKLLNAPISSLVLVPNATTGINTVLRGLRFAPGDVILYFDTIYGACEKTVAYVCETTPARCVKIACGYPVEDAWMEQRLREVVREVQDQGGRVRLAIFDTVVSMPGVRVPFEALVRVCRELGVLSCVDGAHGVGHVELDLGSLDPDFFVSNCHKYGFLLFLFCLSLSLSLPLLSSSPLSSSPLSGWRLQR